MSDDILLKKIGEIIIANNETLLNDVEKRIDKKIQASEKRLKQELLEKIESSQIDTIETITMLQ